MKRQLLILLVILTITLFASGCENAKAQSSLKILIDAPLNSQWGNNSFIQENDYKAIMLYMERCSDGTNSTKIEYEFLPEGQTEREVKIQALRTEIMAGGGPDIFLVISDPPGGTRGNSTWNVQFPASYEREMLFANPESAMKSKLFLPLDNYLKDSSAVDTSLILPAVLEAGKTEEGQMILPITFTFPVATCLESSVPKQLPENWEDGISSDNPAVRNAYTAGAWHRFSNLFDSLEDFGKLTFSREELLEQTKEALVLTNQNALLEKLASTNYFVEPNSKSFISSHEFDERNSPFPFEEFQGFLSVCSLNYSDLAEWSSNHYDYRWSKNCGEQQCFALHNNGGGVTAEITAYAAISRNTKKAEEAFRVLDIMLNTDMLSGYGILDPISPQEERCYQMLLYWSCFGIPARMDLLQNVDQSFSQTYVSKFAPDVTLAGERDKVFAEYTALRSEVTHARFYGTLDQELQTMYEACLEAESDEEIEKIVSKAYDTMLMILAES